MNTQKAWLLGISSFILWGLLPLFWALLKHEPALVVLANRIFWGAVSLLPVIYFSTNKNLKALLPTKSELKLYILSALILSVNWGIYIWAVSNKFVLASSLGYFTAPILYSLVSVFIFKERLDIYKILAFTLGFIALGVLSSLADITTIFVALGLSVSIVSYGIVHKKNSMPAIRSIYVEALILSPFTLIYLISKNGNSIFTTTSDESTMIFLILSGIVTVVPLLCYAYAVKSLPIYSIGVMQYISPILQFLLGLYFFNEPLDSPKLVAFILVWIAILLSMCSVVVNRQKRKV